MPTFIMMRKKHLEDLGLIQWVHFNNLLDIIKLHGEIQLYRQRVYFNYLLGHACTMEQFFRIQILAKADRVGEIRYMNNPLPLNRTLAIITRS